MRHISYSPATFLSYRRSKERGGQSGEPYKMDMVRQNKWKDNARKVLNPGKSHFFKVGGAVHSFCELPGKSTWPNIGEERYDYYWIALNSN